ncbi:MAG: hypothetical protein ACU826_02695 [Gammaproteobacteria bacterium]
MGDTSETDLLNCRSPVVAHQLLIECEQNNPKRNLNCNSEFILYIYRDMLPNQMPPADKPRGFSFFRISSLAAACLVVGAALNVWSEAANAETKIVPFSPVKQSRFFTREDLREIFFGRRTRWADGSPLRVFVLPDQHPVHIRFSKEILEVYPYQLRSAWDRMVYSGTGAPPMVVESLEKMQTLIQHTPGAIGYIEK